MFSLAHVLTDDEKKISTKINLGSLHSEIPEKERFLRELEKTKKVYFDWVYHGFFVRLNPNIAWEDSNNWVDADP